MTRPTRADFAAGPHASAFRGEFSVVQFFADETYEYVRRAVGPEEAVHTAKSLSESVGARIGNTRRVIITDGGDCIAFEWKFGEGVVFPPREALAQQEEDRHAG